MMSSNSRLRLSSARIPFLRSVMSNYRVSRIIFSVTFLGLIAWAAFPPSTSAVSSAAKYRPVSPEELKMTSEPAAPGAPAVLLYREVYRDDSGRTAHEDDY